MEWLRPGMPGGNWPDTMRIPEMRAIARRIDPKFEGEIIEKAFVKLYTRCAEILQLSAEVAFIEVKSLPLDSVAFGLSRSLKCGIVCVLGSGLRIFLLCTS